jgi:hypothetical protein
MKLWLTAFAAATLAAGLAARGYAPARPSLAGVWTLDREHSAFPADIGFDVPAALLKPLTSTQGGGRGRGGGGGGAVPSPIVTESQDDAQRVHQLLAELKDPPVTLTITDTDALVTLSASNGSTRAFHTNGKEDIQQLKDVPVATRAKWVGNKLEVTYAVEKDRVVRYEYSRADDRAPLVVAASARDHNKGDVITRVYTQGRSPK